MERPFQFSDDRDGARSPFNQQLLKPITQPPATSFKTNVNRSKTRKWAEAKNYSYDGDDWGGYDPYDEYGSYDDKGGAPAADARRNSFETGDETTAFSSGPAQQAVAPAPLAHTTSTKPLPQAQPQPQDDRSIRRDFSQIAHVPPPLKTHTSPQAVRERFPARKSSLPSSPAQASQLDQPMPDTASTPSTAKPLPFIRPADIYKRMEEERTREQERKNSVGQAPVEHEEGQASLQATPEKPPAGTSLNASLPTVSRVASGFGSEFWNASELSKQLDDTDTPESVTTAVEATVPVEENSPEDTSAGLHAAVSQAFDRRVDDLSVPPTPISRDNSQSGHGSDTAGISPIMSRVPSAATAEAKARIADNRNMGAIAEESSLPGSPGSRPSSSQQQSVVRKASPAHSRHVSAESFSNSPARTPQLEYTKRLSTPMSAESTSLQDEEAASPTASPYRGHPITSVRVIAPSADYSRRESDIVAEASSSSPSDTAEAAKSARAQFLQTHTERTESPAVTSPVDRSPSPASHRGSPGPSRVRDLAGKYNELHTLSRSSSAMSFNSKNSDTMSLKRSGTFESNHSENGDAIVDGNVVESIEQASPARPEPDRGFSFRPHLPGEWVSYVGTPSSEAPVAQEATRGREETNTTHPDMETPRQAVFPSTEDFDPAPATVKQPLAHRNIEPKESSPVDAVRAAGDALGAALLSTFGQNHGTKDFAQPEPQSPEKDLAKQDQVGPRPSVGDVYLRPLMVDRMASSVASSVAPTPLPKDTPEGLNLQRASGYFPPPPLRVNSDAISPASEYSPADLESDRLRREIERSLTPQFHSEDQQTRDQDALDAPGHLHEVQKAEGFSVTDNQPLVEPPVVIEEPKEAPSALPSANATQAANPGLLGKRFSFEKDQANSGLWGEVGEETKRASYERPRSSVGLHVVNTNVSSSSSSGASSIKEIPAEALNESTAAPRESATSPLSPVTSPDVPAVSTEEDRGNTVSAPAVHFPTEVDRSMDEQPLPTPPAEADTTAAPRASTSAARIPPFREILALKSVHERIDTYNSTRDQFASMDTGLSNWLSSTLSSHPEHAHVVTDAMNKPATSNAVGSIRYKHQPSNIMKMARKGLGGVSSREPSGTHATDSSQTASSVERQNSQGRSVSAQHGGVEKMQTKGKDLLHSAGMLGGKATVGAKGLFARAKGRLREGGSEKASGRAPISNAVLASPTSTNASDDRSTKANNRFSTAFGRFTSGSAERSFSQPSSAVQSPFEGPQLVVSQVVEQPPPVTDVNNGPVAIAPWADELPGGALDKDAENERFKRIGLLPSPAFGGSMVSQESNENSADEGVSKPDVEGTPSREERSTGKSDDTPKVIMPVALPEPAISPQDDPNAELAFDLPASSVDDAKTSADPIGTASQDDPAAVEGASGVINLTRRPVPQQTASDVQPSRRSSVSSLDPEERNVTEASVPLERSVSPLPTETATQPSTTIEQSKPEAQEERRDGSRPPLVGRSSLPSQQRSQSRQSSWQWKGSRTSLVDLGKAQGDASVEPIKGRSISGSVPVSRAESPASFLEMGPVRKQRSTSALRGRSTENLRPRPEEAIESPVAMPPQNLTLVPAPYEAGRMAPIVQSPVEMQPQQHDQFSASMAPESFVGQGAMYTQPSTMSNEQVIYEDVPSRTFSPAVMDPRQQGIEYQLPGVGPPEEAQGSRKSRFFRSPVHSPVQNERINPSAVAFNHQRTFSGDEVPQTQAAQEKRERRRSSMFGALSRGSSFSGLSTAISDGKQSQGNTVAQSNASQGPPTPKARETAGGSTRGNTLKKVQRSSTSAGTPGTPDPEKKKNRFSRLGSIFGRSNSEAKRTNKLVKNIPKNMPERVPEAVVAARTQNMPPQNIPPPPAGMGYGGDAHIQQQHPDEQGSAVPPPPGGWYAPTSRRSSYYNDQQASLPAIQPTMSGQSWQSTQPVPQQQQQQQVPLTQPTRRLHSEGYRHEPRYAVPNDYRSMSPSPLRGQRGSQQYDTTTPQIYQRTPSWDQRQQQPPPMNRNFSWSSMEQQQQQGYFPTTSMPGSPSRPSPSATPTHSRHASLGSMTNIPPPAPPMFRNPSSGALQLSSSPALYGSSQPYQVPMPAPTEAQLMAQTQQDWYPAYSASSGPAQQASTPGMYARGYGNSRPGSSARANSGFGGDEYGRPGSAGGMMVPQQQSPKTPERGGRRRYYGGGGGGTMGPRPYPAANQQQGEWQGGYRDV